MCKIELACAFAISSPGFKQLMSTQFLVIIVKVFLLKIIFKYILPRWITCNLEMLGREIKVLSEITQEV